MRLDPLAWEAPIPSALWRVIMSTPHDPYSSGSAPAPQPGNPQAGGQPPESAPRPYSEVPQTGPAPQPYAAAPQPSPTPQPGFGPHAGPAPQGGPGAGRGGTDALAPKVLMATLAAIGVSLVLRVIATLLGTISSQGAITAISGIFSFLAWGVAVALLALGIILITRQHHETRIAGIVVVALVILGAIVSLIIGAILAGIGLAGVNFEDPEAVEQAAENVQRVGVAEAIVSLIKNIIELGVMAFFVVRARTALKRA